MRLLLTLLGRTIIDLRVLQDDDEPEADDDQPPVDWSHWPVDSGTVIDGSLPPFGFRPYIDPVPWERGDHG